MLKIETTVFLSPNLRSDILSFVFCPLDVNRIQPTCKKKGSDRNVKIRRQRLLRALLRACTCMHVRVYDHVYAYHSYIHSYLNTHKCMCVHTHIYIYACMYLYISRVFMLQMPDCCIICLIICGIPANIHKTVSLGRE